MSSAHRQGLKSTERIVCATNASPAGLKAAATKATAPLDRPGRRQRATKAEGRTKEGVYCVGFLYVPMRGRENRNGQRVIKSLTREFEASHEQNA